ncbi:MAG: UBP-type zinc finger domain-containing protein [Ilyomonas sp.]
MNQDPLCEHLRSLKEIKQPKEFVCEECIKTGSNWVHLRTCQTCGVTLCCDSSPNQHMTKHYHQTHHPVVISAESGEKWIWCYVDDVFAEYA